MICSNVTCQYLPGGSLLEYMASGRIEIDIITAVELFKDISSGMSHIHVCVRFFSN